MNVSDPRPEDFVDITNDEIDQIEFSYSVYFHAVAPDNQYISKYLKKNQKLKSV